MNIVGSASALPERLSTKQARFVFPSLPAYLPMIPARSAATSTFQHTIKGKPLEAISLSGSSPLEIYIHMSEDLSSLLVLSYT